MARIKNLGKRTPISQFIAKGLEEPVLGAKKILAFDLDGKFINGGEIITDPRLLVDRIINPGVLVINTPTSGTLTGLVWVFSNVTYEFTGNVVLPAKPTSPNNRFDIITVDGSPTPFVQAGTPAEDPVLPTPSTPSHLIAQVIYRPHTEPDIVMPEPPAEDLVYQTLQVAGGNGLYAPIWRQTTQLNYSYDFKIGYVFWSSSYADVNNHHIQNGYVAVNFVTNAADRLIDPTRVRITQIDPEAQNGDFALVQTSPTEVTLFARKTGYHGTHFYDYLGPKNATVLKESMLDGQAYAALPAGTTYLSSVAFTDSTGSVTSVAVSGSDGIEIDSGSPITTSGTIALGVNAVTLRAHINVADGANNYSHPNHSGDVISVSDGTTTIANNVVTNAKSANMATKTYKGRTSPLTGAPEDVPVATLKSDLTLVKADVGLGNVDNTSDINKPISTATQTALNLTEAIERESNTVLFDRIGGYIIGNAAARTGNILFDFTGAKLGAETEMRHNTAAAFTFPAQCKFMFDVLDISTTVDNFFLFVLTKKTAGAEIVKVFHALEGGA